MNQAPNTRIRKRFDQFRNSGRKALIPYITAGDPRPEETCSLMHAMVAAGADMIELGVPFSDPMADGPVIQAACERALAAGMTLTGILDIVRTFRQQDTETPVILMGYLNPVEAMGRDRFVQEAAAAGVDGVLTVDLPPEEADSLAPQLRQAGLDSIFLLAPTTQAHRMKQAMEHGSGYLYYVSLKGVTGAATLDAEDVRVHLDTIRAQTELPLAVGFGIRDAKTASAIGRLADGVIVGSALVQRIAEHQDSREDREAALTDFLSGLRRALDDLDGSSNSAS